MTIEEAIDILKNSIADFVIGEYCEKCSDWQICDTKNEDCYFQQAIDIVINLIKKQESEINKLKEKISKAIGHIEVCKTTLGNYILSPNETECLLNILDEERRGEYE